MKERTQVFWMVGFSLCLFALMLFCQSLLQGFGASDCYNNSIEPAARTSCAVALKGDLHQANVALLIGAFAITLAAAAHYLGRYRPMHPEDRF